MSKPDDLSILCAVTPGDALSVSPGTAAMYSSTISADCLRLRVLDLTASHMSGKIVVLDKDKARELFNYLGIWLHTV